MASFIILDDMNPDVRHPLDTPWLTNKADVNSSYRGTISVFDGGITGTGSSQRPSLKVSFWGVGISFYGTATRDLDAIYEVDADNIRRPAEFTFDDSLIGKMNVKLWSLTDLSPALHLLEFFPTAGELNLDYVVYTPTRLFQVRYVNKTVLRDDQDTSIVYSGTQWRHEVGRDLVLPAGLAFNETLTRTTVQGASFAFNFTGTTIAVYGAKHMVSGQLQATFSVDNRTATTFTIFDGTQRVNSSDWELNSQFYATTLEPGIHTLNVEVTRVTGDQVFLLDFLTFEASSTTLFDDDIEPRPTPRTNPKDPNTNRNIIIGVIVGIVFILLALWTWLRKGPRRFVPTVKQPSTNDPNSGVDNYPLRNLVIRSDHEPVMAVNSAQTSPPAPPPYTPPTPSGPPISPLVHQPHDQVPGETTRIDNVQYHPHHPAETSEFSGQSASTNPSDSSTQPQPIVERLPTYHK